MSLSYTLKLSSQFSCLTPKAAAFQRRYILVGILIIYLCIFQLVHCVWAKGNLEGHQKINQTQLNVIVLYTVKSYPSFFNTMTWNLQCNVE